MVKGQGKDAEDTCWSSGLNSHWGKETLISFGTDSFTFQSNKYGDISLFSWGSLAYIEG